MEGRAGLGCMERGWRQHPNEVTPFGREGMEQGCEGEDYVPLKVRELRKRLGSYVRGQLQLRWGRP